MNSDEMIKLEYIDYLDLPPKEIRGKHHDYLVFYDPTKPFSFYDNNIKVEKYFQGIGADALGD